MYEGWGGLVLGVALPFNVTAQLPLFLSLPCLLSLCLLSFPPSFPLSFPSFLPKCFSKMENEAVCESQHSRILTSVVYLPFNYLVSSEVSF